MNVLAPCALSLDSTVVPKKGRLHFYNTFKIHSLVKRTDFEVGPVHTYPFPIENDFFLRFFFFFLICVHAYRFRIVFACPHEDATTIRKKREYR